LKSVPTVLRANDGRTELREQRGTEEVDLELIARVLERDVLDRRHVEAVSRVVDEHVDAAVRVRRSSRRRVPTSGSFVTSSAKDVDAGFLQARRGSRVPRGCLNGVAEPQQLEGRGTSDLPTDEPVTRATLLTLGAKLTSSLVEAGRIAACVPKADCSRGRRRPVTRRGADPSGGPAN